MIDKVARIGGIDCHHGRMETTSNNTPTDTAPKDAPTDVHRLIDTAPDNAPTDARGEIDAGMDNAPDNALAEVRREIDAIDEQVVALLAERERRVRRAAALKTDEQGVRAPARVEQVIAKVRGLAAGSGASPDVVESVYRAMIKAFIDLELTEHRRIGG